MSLESESPKLRWYQIPPQSKRSLKHGANPHIFWSVHQKSWQMCWTSASSLELKNHSARIYCDTLNSTKQAHPIK